MKEIENELIDIIARHPQMSGRELIESAIVVANGYFPDAEEALEEMILKGLSNALTSIEFPSSSMEMDSMQGGESHKVE